MAQRLATEYVKTSLIVNEAQWYQLLQLFQLHNLTFKVKVLDNGDHEVVFEQASGTESLTLTFQRKFGKFVLEGSCRFTDLQLANAMRKAVSQFKGDAVVNRIYEAYTLEYQYRNGAVVRITERSSRGERLVYEHKDTIGELTRTFQNASVEAQIQVVRLEINDWLDRRNGSRDAAEIRDIDAALHRLSHKLFVLEA